MVLLEGSIVDNFFEYNPDYLKIELGIFVAIVVISFFRFIFGKVGLFEDLIYSLGSCMLAALIGMNSSAPIHDYFRLKHYGASFMLPFGILLLIYSLILELLLLIIAVKECKKARGKFKAKIKASYIWGLLLGCARYGLIALGIGFGEIVTQLNLPISRGFLLFFIYMSPLIISFVLIIFWKKITEGFINSMLKLIFRKQKIDKI